jgi:hypothetical protein
MTKASKQELATKKAYNARPENVKKRELNNAARAAMIKAGKVHVGDGKDVNHIKMLEQGGGNTPGNTNIETQKENRGWRRSKPQLYGGKK